MTWEFTWSDFSDSGRGGVLGVPWLSVPNRSGLMEEGENDTPTHTQTFTCARRSHSTPRARWLSDGSRQNAVILTVQ